ncbi:MAG: class I SAM-dependent methyltransferase [Acidobacteriia bacterium]|nr:class I SAM-dependent methyltransferase [Terriglobia bacterium]
MIEFQYVGGELSLFEKARNWKAYFLRQLTGYVRGNVLEVGAGIGANSELFSECPFDDWLCLEPDAGLANQIAARVELSSRRQLVIGTIQDIPAHHFFDTILYLDVLEHIEDDVEEVRRASSHLRTGGHLIVLAPAHQWLYTPFDKAIGHHRRYTVSSLAKTVSGSLTQEKLFYLDSVGLLASLANRLMLKQSLPTEQQIVVWDRWLVPVSMMVDPIFHHRLGKSVLGVWRKFETEV